MKDNGLKFVDKFPKMLRSLLETKHLALTKGHFQSDGSESALRRQ